MARVTAETVDQIARLAHLSLTDEERTTFARQLDEILVYAESIQALDTSEVAPMSHAGDQPMLRPDVPAAPLDRETVLAAAPDPSDGLFRVPRVIAG